MASSQRQRLVGRFVNQTVGSSRKGEKFKVVMKGGKRYHDYGGGRLIADKSGPPKATPPAGVTPSTTKPTTSAPSSGPPAPGPVRGGWGTPSWGKAGVAPPAPTTPRTQTNVGTPQGAPAPAGTYASAAERKKLLDSATGSGARINVVKENPRYGQRFDVVTQGGVRYHKYGKGRKFADKKRGPGSISTSRKAVY